LIPPVHSERQEERGEDLVFHRLAKRDDGRGPVEPGHAQGIGHTLRGLDVLVRCGLKPGGEGGRHVAQRPCNLDDLERTKRIFTALSRAHNGFKGELQIIVLEHADQTAWGDHPNVVPVEDWRGDNDYLIPDAWMNRCVAESGTPLGWFDD
jgi:hypothetical protein